MEITEKFNLKTKALVIILIATLMVAMSTLFCTVKATEEPKLNTKIEFTGKTYKFPNQDKVRKTYAEGEVGCGIVSIISKSAKHPVYVTGEGWIDIEQIVKSEKFIDLNFDNIKNGEFKLTVNGEFVNVDSTNNAVVDYQDGMLTIIGDGKTDVIITTKEGEEIKALATVVNGGLTLSIPDKALAGELSATAEIADKITVEANGDAGVALVIDESGIGVVGEANGDLVLKAEDQEIASASGSVSGEMTANGNGLTANVSAEQRMSLLQKLTLRLKERAGATVNKEQASVSAGGDVEINEKEIASGDASIDYIYASDEATVNANANVMGKDFGTGENPLKFKVVETLRSLSEMLMNKLSAR